MDSKLRPSPSAQRRKRAQRNPRTPPLVEKSAEQGWAEILAVAKDGSPATRLLDGYACWPFPPIWQPTPRIVRMRRGRNRNRPSQFERRGIDSARLDFSNQT